MSRLFKNTRFIKLWLSQIFSLLTINMANFILINRIYEQTSSTFAVTLIWVFYSLPAVLIGPFSGFFVDLWSKRKIMIITSALQGLVVASFFLVGNQFYLFYLGVFAYAFLNQFYFPSEAASIPWLVKKQDFPKANSLFLFTAQLSLLLGFGGGGLLLRFVSENAAIAGCVVFSLLASLAAWRLPQDTIMATMDKSDWSEWAEKSKQGWVFLVNQGRLILITFGIMAGFQILTASLVSMLPAIAKEIFHTTLKEASLGIILPLGIGLVGGAYVFGRSAEKRRKTTWISLGSLGGGIALILLSNLYLLATASRNSLWFIATALFLLLGASASTIIIPCQTFIQEFTPANIRGRVFSLLGVVITISAIPPVLLIAQAIDSVGVKLLLLGMGVSSIIISGLIFIKGHETITNTNNRD